MGEAKRRRKQNGGLTDWDGMQAPPGAVTVRVRLGDSMSSVAVPTAEIEDCIADAQRHFEGRGVVDKASCRELAANMLVSAVECGQPDHADTIACAGLWLAFNSGAEKAKGASAALSRDGGGITWKIIRDEARQTAEFELYDTMERRAMQ